jgi:hypothetical protein
VEAHPYAEDRRLRPRHLGETTLRLGSYTDRIEGGAKDREEGIPLGAELDPTVAGDRRT